MYWRYFTAESPSAFLLQDFLDLIIHYTLEDNTGPGQSRAYQYCLITQ